MVALFEEADGIFINLQGKDREKVLKEQEENGEGYNMFTERVNTLKCINNMKKYA